MAKVGPKDQPFLSGRKWPQSGRVAVLQCCNVADLLSGCCSLGASERVGKKRNQFSCPIELIERAKREAEEEIDRERFKCDKTKLIGRCVCAPAEHFCGPSHSAPSCAFLLTDTPQAADCLWRTRAPLQLGRPTTGSHHFSFPSPSTNPKLRQSASNNQGSSGHWMCSPVLICGVRLCSFESVCLSVWLSCDFQRRLCVAVSAAWPEEAAARVWRRRVSFCLVPKWQSIRCNGPNLAKDLATRLPTVQGASQELPQASVRRFFWPLGSQTGRSMAHQKWPVWRTL